MKCYRLVIALLALACQRPAQACQCGALPESAAALASANVVFSGTVVDITDSWGLIRKFSDRVVPPDHGKLDHDDYFERYGFRAIVTVTAVWKGPVAKRVTVVTGRASGDCGIRFSKGSSYLFYTHRSKSGNQVASVCTRTTEFSRAASDLLALGTPKARP